MAIGDIGDILGTLEFDIAFAEDIKIIHISGTVYAIVYRHEDLHGQLKTVTISADGVTLANKAGPLEFDAAACYYPQIIHISGTVYAIVYTGGGSDGWIKTVTISADGATLALTGQSWEFDAVAASKPMIVHVSGTAYALVYADGYGDGWIKTFTISAAGDLTGSTIDTYEFDVNGVDWTRILHITGDKYLVVFGDSVKDGWIKTFTIDDEGVITTPFLDSYRFDDRYITTLQVVHVKNDIFAIVGQDVGSNGQITTVAVSTAGVITEPYKGRLAFDTDTGIYPSAVHISGNVYAVAYHGVDADGFLKTFTISADGATLALTGQVKKFDLAACVTPWMIHIDGNVYAIAYKGADTDGFLKTVNIETVAPGKPGHLMVMGIG